jgi:hypothetical protein
MRLIIKDGKLFDEETNSFKEFADWGGHEEHTKTRVPLKHVLYLAYECSCGAILIDEEQ